MHVHVIHIGQIFCHENLRNRLKVKKLKVGQKFIVTVSFHGQEVIRTITSLTETGHEKVCRDRGRRSWQVLRHVTQIFNGFFLLICKNSDHQKFFALFWR